MELQRMFVTLALKADEFNSGLREAAGQAEGFRGRLGNAFGKVSAIGQAAFLGVGAAAIGGFGLAMRSAIDMNSSLETSTMMFTTLMGDSDLAAEHVANLFEFAGKTPFETEPIITASKHLQVFGGEALNTMENLTLVGDAAAAVGAPIDEVGFWIGRLYGNLQAGQPFGEAAMRLQELGIMAPTARTELENMQAAGASGAEIFATFQGQLGSFSGAMEMQSQSWTGLTSTIKDQVGLLTAEALRPFFDLLKTGLEGLAAWLSSPDVQTAIQTFAENMRLMIEKVAAFITDQVVPFVQEHGPQIKGALLAIATVILISMIPAAISLVAALAPIILVVAAIAAVGWLLATAWEENWGGIQDKVAAAWDVIRPILENIKNWIVNTVIPAMQDLWKRWTTEWWPAIQQKLSDAWAVIKPILENIKTFITDTVIPAIQELWRKWTQEIWPAIQSKLQEAWAVIQPILEKIKTFIVETVIPAIQDLWKKWTQEIWPEIQTVIENVWTIIEEIFTEVGRWINDNIVPWIEFLKRIWVEEVWPAIQTAIETVWEIIEPIWESIRKWAAETIPPILETLQGVFERIMEGIGTAIQPIKDIWDGFVSAVQGFWDWISNKVFNFQINLPDLPDWAVPGSPLPIHTAWKEFAEDMSTIGKKIADGFMEGLGAINDFSERMEMTLDLAGTMGGIGGGFAGVFEDRVIGPLEDRLDYVTERIETTTAGIDENLAALGMTQATPGLFYMLQRFSTMGSSHQQAAALIALDLMKQRNNYLSEQSDLQSELLYQQQRMAELEQQRANLNFLQQQYEMLKLIRHTGLDPAILSGVTLGLGADPGQLMDIMVRAMTEMVVTAGRELETLNAPTPGFETAGSTLNVQTQNINGGQHIYIYDVDESELELLGVLAR